MLSPCTVRPASNRARELRGSCETAIQRKPLQFVHIMSTGAGLTNLRKEATGTLHSAWMVCEMIVTLGQMTEHFVHVSSGMRRGGGGVRRGRVR